MSTLCSRQRYAAEVIQLYRSTPSVLGHVRQADRDLALRFFDDGVPLYAVRNALLLGAARRVLHNGFSTPMPPVRSLHYFVPILREVMERSPGYRELEQLALQLRERTDDW